MPKAPELTEKLAEEITKAAQDQRLQSQRYKQPRMQRIRESEDLYSGVSRKELNNPFNHSFPFMSGFVDHYLSKIDDAPAIEYTHTKQSAFKAAQKFTTVFEKEANNPKQKWALTDRHVKKLALFSGRGTYKYFAQSDGGYSSHFSGVDHYDFHAEPAGGGYLEKHLYCGEDGIFKTKEDLLEGAKESFYDLEQITKLVGNTNNIEYKDNEDEVGERLNRHRALGLDPQTHNFVGQEVHNLTEWYLTYKGVRWYVLFDPTRTGMWIRIKPLKEVFKSGLYPYVSWATHEDLRVFWNKGPCDDARPVALYYNKALNQELYNREKQNRGQRAYDPNMFYDVAALEDWRPDGLVPADTKNGTRNLREGIMEFNVSGLNGTIDLLEYLNQFFAEKAGTQPGSQGASDKKVGIFFGELRQVDEFIGTRNKSYKEAWGELGIRFINGVDEHLTRPMELMGPKGIEWDTLSREDMKHMRDVDIKVTGGSEEAEKNEFQNQKKAAALGAAQTVNPQWRDRELLKAAGYSEDQIKEAFTMIPQATQELMAEADQSIEDILKGKTPQLNRGANAAFMQRIIDFAKDFQHKNKEKENEIATSLADYAIAHAEIAAENDARTAKGIIDELNTNEALQPQEGGEIPEGDTPVAEGELPSDEEFKQNPKGSAISAGAKASEALQP